MTKAEQMKSVLEKSGIPYNEITVFPANVIIEAASESAINKWSALLAKVGKVLPAVETMRPKGGKTEQQASMSTEHGAYKKVWVVTCFI